MMTILIIAGLFAGIGVFIATAYSLSQILLLEGRGRAAHAACLIMTLIVMGALMERAIPIARVAAIPMLLVASWCFAIERGWFRVFPVLLQIFAAIVALGFVVLT